MRSVAPDRVLAIAAADPPVPAPLPVQVTSLLLGADLLTGGNLVHLPGSVGAFVWGGIVLPTVYVVTAAVNGFLWKDALVLKVGGWGGAWKGAWEGAWVLDSAAPVQRLRSAAGPACG